MSGLKKSKKEGRKEGMKKERKKERKNLLSVLNSPMLETGEAVVT
jgi:hypothetical protein